jgi:hypothetical protein
VGAKQTLAAQLQFPKQKRLHQIVVRAGLQPHHPIARRGKSRENQDRKSLAKLPNPTEHINAMLVWQKKIHKQEIGLALLQLLEQGEGAMKYLKDPTYSLKVLQQKGAHIFVIIKNPDLSPCPGLRAEPFCWALRDRTLFKRRGVER